MNDGLSLWTCEVMASQANLAMHTQIEVVGGHVNAVIQALALDRLILCGWSYAPLVILDYLRRYGEDSIGGVHFVGGITKLGSEQAASYLASIPQPHARFLFNRRRRECAQLSRYCDCAL